DLPKETILHAWNYNITSLESKDSDEGDLEFGGAGGVLKQVDIYKNLGYEVIGCPCMNYGTLFSRFDISVENTRVWSIKSQQAGILGIINSAWACFHVPLTAQNPLTGISGALVKDPELKADEVLAEWTEKEFGTSSEKLAEALETLGALWEIPMPEMGRPFTPLPYGYMNMALFYPGMQEERKRRGAYPLDWNEIDFPAMYKRGVEEIQKGDIDAVYADLDRILKTYKEAAEVIKGFAAGAEKRKAEAEDLVFLAELKTFSAEVFSHLLREDQNLDSLKGEGVKKKEKLADFLRRNYESVPQKRFMDAWMSVYDLLMVNGKG
ncbi:MAG: hypothetical protein ACYTFY_13690, partial [Planctomycetota bacterium]